MKHDNHILIAFQKVAWLSCIFYFLIVSILLTLQAQIAYTLSYWGILLVLAVTIGQLIVIAVDFKRLEKKRFMNLSFILLAVIVMVATVSAFLL